MSVSLFFILCRLSLSWLICVGFGPPISTLFCTMDSPSADTTRLCLQRVWKNFSTPWRWDGWRTWRPNSLSWVCALDTLKRISKWFPLRTFCIFGLHGVQKELPRSFLILIMFSCVERRFWLLYNCFDWTIVWTTGAYAAENKNKGL